MMTRDRRVGYRSGKFLARDVMMSTFVSRRLIVTSVAALAVLISACGGAASAPQHVFIHCAKPAAERIERQFAVVSGFLGRTGK